MALTTQIEQLKLQKWNADAFREYNRTNLFGPYIGAGTNAVIQTKRDLIGSGKTLTMGLVYELDTSHVGTNTLEGRETEMSFAYHTALPVWIRKAVSFKKSENHASIFDLLNEGRTQIVGFRRNKLRDRIIEALGAVASDVVYANEGNGIGQQIAFWDTRATSTILNTYVTNNANRLLFGSQQSNLATGDWAASLANVDATNDKFSYDTIVQARDLARASVPGVRQAIRPLMEDGGSDMYVMFVSPSQYQQAWKDSTIADFHKQALPRAKDHPFMKAGDIMVQDILIREIPELGNGPAETYLAARGASSAPLTAGYLCGAQAICQAIAQPFRATAGDRTDYNFITSIGTESYDAVEKMFFNNQQYGVVSVFTAK